MTALQLFTIINKRGVLVLNCHTRSAAISNFLTVGGLMKGGLLKGYRLDLAFSGLTLS